MQEEISKQQIAYAVKLGKGGLQLTGKTLLKLIKAINQKKGEVTQGKKVSLGKLQKQGVTLESVEVNNSNIGRFKHSARRFGVEFSIKKDRSTGENYLFFKGKDKDSISLALKDFYHKDEKYRKSAVFKGKENIKSSVLGKIKELKQQIKNDLSNVVDKEKKRNKGELSI